MSERYTSSESPVLAGKFTTGATVTITIIKLSDESVVVNAAACDEVGATGYFKYTYTPEEEDVSEEFLWTMTDGSDEVAGSFIIGDRLWPGSSSGVPSDDSYIGSSADLETMIGDDPRPAAIALKAATEAAQAWYCQEATRRIDALPLRGTKYEYDQDLAFPRIIDGVIVGDEDYNAVVPDQVARACLEEALAIYKMNDAPELDYKAMGIQQLQLGTGAGFQVTFAPGASNVPGLLSSESRRLMRRYIGAVLR